jgi:hypothetical protein
MANFCLAQDSPYFKEQAASAINSNVSLFKKADLRSQHTASNAESNLPVGAILKNNVWESALRISGNGNGLLGRPIAYLLCIEPVFKKYKHRILSQIKK